MATINVEYLGRRYGGNQGEKSGCAMTLVDAYRLEKESDVHRLTPFFQQKIGFAYLFNPPFFLESWSFARVGDSEGGDGLTIEVELKLVSPSSAASGEDRSKDVDGNELTEETPPWLYRLENWRCSSASEEVAATAIFPENSNVAVPFVNSAGVALQATTTRGLLETSFEYNVESLDISALTNYVGCVNASPIVVAGITFAARTLKIESLDASEEVSYLTDGSVKWRYVKVSVKLLGDPGSWNRDFLNVGNHLATNSGLQKIWQWTNANGSTVYGTYAQALASQAPDAEETTEPLFLNAQGTAVSPIDSNGRQTPTYITGTLLKPLDFSPLQFPKVK